jgi:dTDP-4-amino-4,6-dideoxygalactose transaminase
MLSIGVAEMAAALRVLARGDLNRYSARGVPETSLFEADLAKAMNVRHARAVNSGTSALICALVGAGIGPGNEVLVPAYTWVSTAAAPLAAGAVPVLVEIDESLTIDPDDIRRKITPYTRAIMPVHMLNLVCNMDAIMAIAREHGLIVIEDASQAVGVRYRDSRVGTIGHAGAYSFNQHKNIKSGEGGAVLTNDDRIFARASMYHDVGSYEREEQLETDEPLFVGVNYRMPELSAAILRTQLKRLDRQLASRRLHRRILLDELASSSFNWSISPHHDEPNAAGIAVRFDSPEEAACFGAARGAFRLIDTGRHVYTNWLSLLTKRSAHPALNPYDWAHREISYPHDCCPETLSILSHTCSLGLAPELPTPAFRFLARRIVHAARPSHMQRGAVAAASNA